MKKKLDPEQLRVLVEVEKLQQVKIAELLGCSKTCVGRTCKRLGLRTQRTGPRSGPQHPDWMGGRVLIGGYWYIWNNTHPNRTLQNRVAEHRLVVEQMIGRFLEKHEVVHHINGDSQDNRPENLALFGSNAEHLRHELTGKVPNWSPEGLAKLAKVREQNAKIRRTKHGDSARTQSTDHSEAKV